jgi:hypothetical protein
MSKEREMFAIIERWQRSGLSKAEFARRSGLPIKTLYYWCNRYFDGDAPSTTPAFIEVTDEPPESVEARSPRIHVELPDGLSITVY